MIHFLKKYLHCWLIALMIVPSVVWIFLDQHVWPWDPAWYGEVSVDLYYKLTHSFLDWPKAMLTAMGVKAPGLAWIGQFFVLLSGLGGSVDSALLLSVVAAQGITLIYVYKIVMQLTNMRKNLALLASLIMSSAPLFVGLGHHYFVESFQLLSVTLFVYVVVRMKDWNRYQIVLAIVSISALAMVVKVTSPLYIIVPAILVFINFFRHYRHITLNQYFRVKSHILLYLLAFCFLLMVVGWYVTNGQAIFEFMHQASSGSLAELYGRKGDFLSKFYVWLIFFKESFFISVSIWFLGVLGVFLMIKRLFARHLKLDKMFFVLANSSFLSVLIVLVSFSLQVNEETRYLLPILIYVVVLIIALLYKLNTRWITVCAWLCFVIQFFVVHSSAFGLIQEGMVHMRGWNTRLNLSQEEKNMVNHVINQTCAADTANATSVIGVELPGFNANSIEYYATLKKLELDYQCYYTSLGYVESDSERAYHRFKNLIKAPYFITLLNDEFKEGDAFNSVSKTVRMMIELDGDFQEIKTYAADAVRVFKRVARTQ